MSKGDIYDQAFYDGYGEGYQVGFAAAFKEGNAQVKVVQAKLDQAVKKNESRGIGKGLTRV